MDREEIPTLGYAAGPPRSMRKRIAFAVSIGVAGIAVTAGMMVYRARQARSICFPGIVVSPQAEWAADTIRTRDISARPGETRADGASDPSAPHTNEDNEQNTAIPR